MNKIKFCEGLVLKDLFVCSQLKSNQQIFEFNQNSWRDEMVRCDTYCAHIDFSQISCHTPYSISFFFRFAIHAIGIPHLNRDKNIYVSMIKNETERHCMQKPSGINSNFIHVIRFVRFKLFRLYSRPFDALAFTNHDSDKMKESFWCCVHAVG